MIRNQHVPSVRGKEFVPAIFPSATYDNLVRLVMS